ncbi:histidinol-phosphate transaminase [Tuwongella immobilis]|uniref:Histidinol-phosphate aminotransferase n=1 Tax=Tuwongella immobilis TaxID=692036 RepID=A0A6C2YVT9_9BACT|nr:histidinol-phosphate transaminase [Tuwongella immobilis]VIP05740.1 histidinol-phosphate aminotransferase : Histidinol-phosphate aminotransferase OS=Singulisphaera acidiphila (strain ATCC BAA-1392 / DSM 18658 / VKM B-2454 / MOB10) GN=hisC PE=3 SV=1: Aminotran_1_2 [Tuwongella immobilis]VTS08836.1 histidinol-phosphate aminotransferase : Histidinol-phosphate aminotransferase OS=Singulisphaera acidiphila (strain ATCC BAA-1392 / DSM 18658 / VKM B-2454 / MOB10) GN=hisC PE=3 SV=1: Aminotran_1_2 [Tuwon
MASVRPNVRAMTGYVPGEQPRGDQIIKLNTNESPYPPSPSVFAAIQAHLTGDRLRKYPDPTGRAFREVAARVLGVDPDGIVIGNGSDDILTILTRTFVPDQGLMVSATPSYILYRNLAEIQNARFQLVPFADDWTLPQSWPVPKADLTFLANPNSPSGTRIDSHGIQQLLGQLDSPLVLDEAYVDFAPENGVRFSQSSDHSVIVTRTLSKSYALAGIRFGYAVTRPDIAYEMNKVRDSYNCDVLALAAATAALDDQAYLRDIVGKMIATRERMTQAVRELGFTVTPSQANFIWCRRPPEQPVKPLYEALKAKGILVRYMNYPGSGDGLRMSVGTDTEIDRLLEELRRLV